MKISSITASLCLLALSVSPLSAQEGKDFFNGKVVEYIVGTAPGGVYDTNGRLIAQYMQEELPGSTFIVRNMAGAGGLIGANYIYASDPDGLTIGTFNTGLIYSQLTENPALKFDMNDMNWIGKLTTDPRVWVVTPQSGIETFEDLMNAKDKVKFATCGVGCSSMVETNLLVSTFELPVEVISGYNGNEGQLAMMRGEVQGTLGSRSEFEQFIADGHGRFIAQIGGDHDDVPQVIDYATNENQRKSVELVGALGQLGRWTATPPGLPEDRMNTLREAFAAAMQNPEFLEKAEMIHLPVDPLVGDEVGKLVQSALEQPDDVVELLKSSMKGN